MPAYVMAQVHATNFGPEIIEYLRSVDATMQPFDGRFLVHGGPVDAVEGTWSGDLIIIEFRRPVLALVGTSRARAHRRHLDTRAQPPGTPPVLRPMVIETRKWPRPIFHLKACHPVG